MIHLGVAFAWSTMKNSNIRQTLMSLNTKQKLAVVAVIGGLVTLPVVYAMTDDPMIELIKQKQGTQLKQPPVNGIVNVNDDKTTQTQYSQIQTISNTTIGGGEGPAARSNKGMIPRDYPANDSMGQLIANNSNNNFDNSGSSSTGHHCEYSKDAIKAGVKHYWFAQADEGTLVEVGGGHKLTPEAAAALRKLQAAARADGISLTVGSAFRSVSYQQGIVNRKKAAGQSDAQIYKVSSAPHYSEHHTGYALDFSPINNSFANTKAYSWLRQHAPAMGWEQSFTPESVRDTRVAVESWHWKYKGSPTARAALANDVCYTNPNG